MTLPVLSREEALAGLREPARPYQGSYLAMYSSYIGGIVTDPDLMVIPMDDHMVHRGDGIFEAMSCVNGGIYNLHAHLDRLEHSAGLVRYELTWDRQTLVDAVLDTVRAAKVENAHLRVFVSRGPGSFGVSPFDCPALQLYIVVTAADHDAALSRYDSGVSVGLSEMPVKPSFFATVKSCNYLPNVLMKYEAAAQNVDFVIGRDEAGNLAEGASENIGLISSDGELLFPELARVLRGTSMVRVAGMAESLLTDGLLSAVSFRPVNEKDAEAAREIILLGTTPGIIPVIEFNGESVGEGVVGPVFRRLNELLLQDVYENADRRTLIA